MSQWLHAEYRDFHDVPRMIVCTNATGTFLFQSRFDDDRGEYLDFYEVYRLPPIREGEACLSWFGLETRALERLPDLPVDAFPFDVARRAFLEYDSIAALLTGGTQANRMDPHRRRPGGPQMNLALRPSREEVVALLASCGLPSDDIEPSLLEHFHVAREGATAVGVAGLQLFGGIGLLRSVGVAPAARSRGLGGELVRRAEQHAREQGVNQLYLLTNDATAFFARHGYRELQRCSAPPEIQRTSQFGSSCCSGATLMHKELED